MERGIYTDEVSEELLPQEQVPSHTSKWVWPGFVALHGIVRSIDASKDALNGFDWFANRALSVLITLQIYQLLSLCGTLGRHADMSSSTPGHG